MQWIKSSIVLGAVLAAGGVQAVPVASLRENYQTIIERNPFGLKPPPPPATNNTAEPVKEKPKVQIYLTGITSVGYPATPKRVYFFTKEQGKKDEPVYYSMTENASENGYTVLGIDAEKRAVRLRTDEGETLLTFDTHGLSLTNAASVLPQRPNIPAPGQAVAGVAGATPTPLPTVNQSASAQPTYNLQRNNSTTGNSYNANSSSTGLRQIPSRSLRVRPPNQNAGGNDYVPNPGQSGQYGTQQPQAEQPDLAEQYLRMHLNREAKEREGIPMPPVPILQ